MKSLVLFLSAMLPLATFAAERTITCAAPQGTRVDYFLQNSANLQNDTFLMGRDKVDGMQPKITLNDDNQNVKFVIGDASQLQTQTKAGDMKVLIYTSEQISFTGLVNGAPIMATYYPQLNILIYSQQSVWPAPNFQGARAVIFYARCGI